MQGSDVLVHGRRAEQLPLEGQVEGQSPRRQVMTVRGSLIARMHGRSGLLLPQVPLDWGWGREEFLRRTCEKAGLPPESWRSADCQLLAFEAQIFEEASPA